MAYIARDVHRGGRLLELLEESGQREYGAAILADDDRRDALADIGERVAVLEDLVVGVAVRVNESRREHEAARVDDRLALTPMELPDVGDAVANDPHILDDRGASRAVEHARALDQYRL